jgi:Tfp pilus assembly protein PilE
MRGLGIVDVLVIAAVVALLAFLATRDFGRYAGKTASPSAVAPTP